MRTPMYRTLGVSILLSLMLAGCQSKSPEEYLAAGQQAFQSGDYTTATVQLKNALQAAPDNIEARILLGKTLQIQGEWEDSEKELRKALELGGAKEDVLPALVRTLIKVGKIQEALDIEVPKSGMGSQAMATLQAERANAFIFRNDTEAASNAIREGEAALERTGAASFSKDLHLAKARLAFKNGDQALALRLIEETLQREPEFIDALYTKAQILVLADKLTEAFAVYEQVTRIRPTEVPAHLAMFELRLHAGELDKAEQLLKTAESINPAMPHVKFTRARMEVSRGNYRKAQELLQQILRDSPNHTPSILLHASVNYALGSHEQSLKDALRVVAIYPDDLYSAKLVIANRIRLGEAKEALDALAPLLRQYPDDVKLLGMAAEANMQDRQYGKAMGFLERAAGLSPRTPEIKLDLARAHLAQGQSEQALATMEAAAKLDSPGSVVDMNLILLRMARREFDQALLIIDRLERTTPANPITHSLRAAALLGKQDRAGARQAYQRALDSQRDFHNAAIALAEMDFQDGNLTAARTRLETVVRQDAGNLAALLALADIAQAEKKPAEYIRRLEQAIKSNPKALPPRAGLVSHYLANNAPQKALSAAREATLANPDNPIALSMLANAQFFTGDRAGALANLEKATQKAPRSAEAHYRRGMVEISANLIRQGRTSLETALELQPGHIEALDGLLLLDFLENRHDRALQRARAFQTQNPRSPVGITREADIHLMRNRFAEAAKAYEQALALGAGFKEHVKLLESLARAGNLPAAYRRIEDSLRSQPGNLMLQRHAAEFYMTHGQNAAAIRLYESLRGRLPNDALLLNNLAWLYKQGGDRRALATAERAHKLDARHPAIADTYGWLLVQHGQAERGLELLRYAKTQAKDVPGVAYRYAAALARLGRNAEARAALDELLRKHKDFL